MQEFDKATSSLLPAISTSRPTATIASKPTISKRKVIMESSDDDNDDDDDLDYDPIFPSSSSKPSLKSEFDSCLLEPPKANNHNHNAFQKKHFNSFHQDLAREQENKHHFELPDCASSSSSEDDEEDDNNDDNEYQPQQQKQLHPIFQKVNHHVSPNQKAPSPQFNQRSRNWFRKTSSSSSPHKRNANANTSSSTSTPSKPPNPSNSFTTPTKVKTHPKSATSQKSTPPLQVEILEIDEDEDLDDENSNDDNGDIYDYQFGVSAALHTSEYHTKNQNNPSIKHSNYNGDDNEDSSCCIIIDDDDDDDDNDDNNNNNNKNNSGKPSQPLKTSKPITYEIDDSADEIHSFHDEDDVFVQTTPSRHISTITTTTTRQPQTAPTSQLFIDQKRRRKLQVQRSSLPDSISYLSQTRTRTSPSSNFIKVGGTHSDIWMKSKPTASTSTRRYTTGMKRPLRNDLCGGSGVGIGGVMMFHKPEEEEEHGNGGEDEMESYGKEMGIQHNTNRLSQFSSSFAASRAKKSTSQRKNSKGNRKSKRASYYKRKSFWRSKKARGSGGNRKDSSNNDAWSNREQGFGSNYSNSRKNNRKSNGSYMNISRQDPQLNNDGGATITF